MGSTDEAFIAGFICRLCWKMNKFVIYIYGELGKRMRLEQKIRRGYLSIDDNMPKTVCLDCIAHLELEEFSRAQMKSDPGDQETEEASQFFLFHGGRPTQSQLTSQMNFYRY